MSGPPVRHGAVLVHSGRIAALETRSPIDESESESETVIVPGLVDCHAHLELAGFLGAAHFGDLFELMTHVGDARRTATSETLQRSREAACARALECGVTAVVDWSSLRSPRHYPTRRPRTVRALEIIGPRTDAADSRMVELRRALEEHDATGLPDRDKIAVAPHSLYMTSAALWEQAVTLAKEHGLLVTSHWAETPDEVEWVRTGTGRLATHCRSRSDIANWPTSAGVTDAARDHLGHRMLAVHGTAFDDRDLKALAATGTPLCLCPRSNLQTSGTTPSLRKLLHHGVSFVVGTDSFAASQDLLAEARVLLDEFPDLPSRRAAGAALLEAMTIRAADHLDWPAIGRIAPGAWADLVLVRVPKCKAPEDVPRAVIEHGTVLATVQEGKLMTGAWP